MKLRIRIGNIEFEAEGDNSEIERERTAVMEFLEHLSSTNSDIILQPAIQANNNAILLDNNNATVFQSLNEFLKTINAKKNTDIAMAAAYFLYKYKNVDSFTSRDIEELLTESHIKRPGNISQSIAQNIKKGFISSTKGEELGSKVYQVLTSADDWLNDVKNNKD